MFNIPRYLSLKKTTHKCPLHYLIDCHLKTANHSTDTLLPLHSDSTGMSCEDMYKYRY